MEKPSFSSPPAVNLLVWRILPCCNIHRLAWLKYGILFAFFLGSIVLYTQSESIFFFNIHSYGVNRSLVMADTSNIPVHTSPTRSRHGDIILSAQLDPGEYAGTNSKVSQNVKVPHETNTLKLSLERYQSRLASLNKTFLQQKVVNPHDFGYVITPNVSCTSRDIKLVICVPITRKNVEGRQVIRDTWGSYARHSGNNAVLVFFLGSAANSSHTDVNHVPPSQKYLEEESQTFGDILQEDFIDSYSNLSLKSVSILKWVSHFCPNAKYVLKADDDMYINVPLLVQTLDKLVSSPSMPSAFVVGSQQVGAKPDRHPMSKWYTPESLFGGQKYPKYVSGTAYAMTNETALLLFEASLRVPMFWLEDIYITGLCARNAGVRTYNDRRFRLSKPKPSGCSFQTLISGHRYNNDQISFIHQQLYDPNLNCPSG